MRESIRKTALAMNGACSAQQNLSPAVYQNGIIPVSTLTLEIDEINGQHKSCLHPAQIQRG